MPGVSLVQVVHVNGPEAIAEATAIAPEVDAILLDSGNQSLPIKELGGTGRTHDWRLSRAIRESVSVPLFLAGGLKPENVAAAIREVRPFGVDVCSGLRTEGRLDPQKLAAFFSSNLFNLVQSRAALLPPRLRRRMCGDGYASPSLKS